MEPHQQANANYQLQHKAFAVFDLLSKKWRIEAEGDLTAAKILGVIASKKHGARAIQLPNHTHKIVAGIIDAQLLMNLFAQPAVSSDLREITLNPVENGTIPFIAIVPQNRSRTLSEPKPAAKSQYKHLEYVLHSGKETPTEEVKRSDLAWTSSPKKTMSLVNGTDVEDLSRYKNILSTIRSDLLEDHV